MKPGKKAGKKPIQRSSSSKNGQKIRVLLDRYSNGEIETILELVGQAENIKNPQVQKAVDNYLRFQQEDRYEYGMRGDWDEAEREFINALEELASECLRAKEEKEVVNQIALSPRWKQFLDKAISEGRPIDAILVSDKVEDGKASREYLRKAGYVLKDDKYVP